MAASESVHPYATYGLVMKFGQTSRAISWALVSVGKTGAEATTIGAVGRPSWRPRQPLVGGGPSFELAEPGDGQRPNQWRR